MPADIINLGDVRAARRRAARPAGLRDIRAYLIGADCERAKDRAYAKVLEAVERTTPRAVGARLVAYAQLYWPEERASAIRPLLDAMPPAVRATALNAVRRRLSLPGDGGRAA